MSATQETLSSSSSSLPSSSGTPTEAAKPEAGDQAALDLIGGLLSRSLLQVIREAARSGELDRLLRLAGVKTSAATAAEAVNPAKTPGLLPAIVDSPRTRPGSISGSYSALPSLGDRGAQRQSRLSTEPTEETKPAPAAAEVKEVEVKEVPPPPPLPPSDLLRRFQVTIKEGEDVLNGQERGTHRPILVRIFRNLGDQTDTLIERARLAAGVLAHQEHPNLEAVVGVGMHHEHPFIATAAIPGRSLAELLPTRLPLSEGEALKLIVQVARGLQALHFSCNIIHGDLKPEHILIEYSGIAGAMDLGESERIVVAGYLGERIPWHQADRIPADADPTYIAPELMNAPSSDPTADIYSLGALLFHLLSGNPPMPPGTAPAAERLREWKQPDFSLLPEGISEPTRSILGTALSRMPNGRFLTFYGLMTACEKAVQQLSDGALQSIRLLRKPMTKPAQALPRPDMRTPAPGSLAIPDEADEDHDSALVPKITDEQAKALKEGRGATDLATRIVRKFEQRRKDPAPTPGGTGAYHKASTVCRSSDIISAAAITEGKEPKRERRLVEPPKEVIVQLPSLKVLFLLLPISAIIALAVSLIAVHYLTQRT